MIYLLGPNCWSIGTVGTSWNCHMGMLCMRWWPCCYLLLVYAHALCCLICFLILEKNYNRIKNCYFVFLSPLSVPGCRPWDSVWLEASFSHLKQNVNGRGVNWEIALSPLKLCLMCFQDWDIWEKLRMELTKTLKHWAKVQQHWVLVPLFQGTPD